MPRMTKRGWGVMHTKVANRSNQQRVTLRSSSESSKARPLCPPYSGGICEMSMSCCIVSMKSVPIMEIFARVLHEWDAVKNEHATTRAPGAGGGGGVFGVTSDVHCSSQAMGGRWVLPPFLNSTFCNISSPTAMIFVVLVQSLTTRPLRKPGARRTAESYFVSTPPPSLQLPPGNSRVGRKPASPRDQTLHFPSVCCMCYSFL